MYNQNFNKMEKVNEVAEKAEKMDLQKLFDELKKGAFEDIFVKREDIPNELDANLGIFVEEDRMKSFVGLIKENEEKTLTSEMKIILEQSKNFAELFFFSGILMKMKEKALLSQFIDLIKSTPVPSEAKILLLMTLTSLDF